MENRSIELKKQLWNDMCPCLPNYNKKLISKIDVSNTCLEVSLLQMNKDGNTVKRWKSRKLTNVEQNYGIIGNEFLALVWGIK